MELLPVLLLGTASLGLLSLAAHLAWCAAFKPEATARIWDGNGDEFTWKRKVYLVGNWIAYGLLIYGGVYFMLGWMPEGWGSITEDGDYRSTREHFSGLVALIGAFGIPAALFNLSTERTQARIDAFYREQLLELVAAPPFMLQGKRERLQRYAEGDFSEAPLGESTRLARLPSPVFLRLARAVEDLERSHKGDEEAGITA